MAIDTPVLPPDETANRARLANVATYGAAGHNLPLDAVPPPTDPRQAAIDAALGRGQQINATAPVQNAVAGQIGQVYDTGNAGLGAIRGATGGVVGGMANAASEYERQLALAAPIEQGRNKVAIQQILAERQAEQNRSNLSNRQVDFSNKQLDQEMRDWELLHGEGAAPKLGSPVDAGKRVGFDKSQVQAMLTDPSYSSAREWVLQNKADGYNYDEFVGSVKSLINNTDQVKDENGLPTEPNIDDATAALIIEQYGPQFMTAAERKAADVEASKRPGATTNAERDALGKSVAAVGTAPYAKQKASLRTSVAAHHGLSPAVAKKVATLAPHQWAILKQIADASGMTVEQYLAANPELLK